MNALQVDSVTGFLESVNPLGQAFTVEKKLELLNLAREHREKFKTWPDFSLLCKTVGISLLTLERHIKQDGEFAAQFKELTLSGKFQAESDMYDMRKKNPMFMFGWLRKWFPEEYNPDYKHSISIDINVVKGDNGKLGNIVDAEVVSPSENR